MGSKVAGLGWKASQRSIGSTDDYLDPVSRKQRKTIGKIIVREEHTEFIKTEPLQDTIETKMLVANMVFIPSTHEDFPDQPIQNMIDVVSKEIDLMSDYIDLINSRIERLGVSPTPTPPPTPPRVPTPNIFQAFFCHHRERERERKREIDTDSDRAREKEREKARPKCRDNQHYSCERNFLTPVYALYTTSMGIRRAIWNTLGSVISYPSLTDWSSKPVFSPIR
eukprot:sb/3469683/